RRVGKTILMFQAIKKLIKQDVDPKKILFLSLDNINLTDFDVYKYVLSGEFEYLFFDEIQYFTGWEKLLKSLFDLPKKDYKIICSGSSYKTISLQKGLLTGRNSVIEMFPLDYKEYKKFEKTGNYNLDNYLKFGGYPEYVLEKNPNYLSELLKDIVNKDIINIYHIRNKQVVFEILRVISKQIGCKNSYQKISHVVGVSDDTVKNYISHLNEVRLIGFISKYSESPKDIAYSQKKYYFLDTGVRNSLTGFEDIGSLVENTVFVKLLRRYGEEKIFYVQNQRGKEVDFLVKLNEKECILIESKYKKFKESILEKLSNIFLKKEIYGLKPIRRVVVTDNLNSKFVVKDKEVELVSLESFLNE
ncbi:ATP-binding protein, partial [Patescibacteria group bacterium]|nr:ATP-binding protein [Patescibacteria group bacterium]